MKCEVLIGQDAEDARLAGKRLLRWNATVNAWRPWDQQASCFESDLYRLADEQPVPPGDLTYSEAVAAIQRHEPLQCWRIVSEEWRDSAANKTWNTEELVQSAAYRRKPVVKRVNLCREDVDILRTLWRRRDNLDEWFTMPSVSSHGIGGITWQHLREEVERSTDYGETWQECSKEVV